MDETCLRAAGIYGSDSSSSETASEIAYFSCYFFTYTFWTTGTATFSFLGGILSLKEDVFWGACWGC